MSHPIPCDNIQTADRLSVSTACNRDRKKQRRHRRDLDPSPARSKRIVVLPLIERSRHETRVSRSENSTKRQRSRLLRNGLFTRAVKALCLGLMRERRVESPRHPSRDDSKGSMRKSHLCSIVPHVSGCNDIHVCYSNNHTGGFLAAQISSSPKNTSVSSSISSSSCSKTRLRSPSLNEAS